MKITDIDESLLGGLILEFLCLQDRRQCLSICRYYFFQIRPNIEGAIYEKLKLRRKGRNSCGHLLSSSSLSLPPSSSSTGSNDGYAAVTITSMPMNVLSCFRSLKILDIGHHASDHFLFFLSKKYNYNDPNTTTNTTTTTNKSNNGCSSPCCCLLPVLESISLVGSVDVTDYGLDYLSRDGCGCETRYNHLKYIDITFCSKTTYEGTFIVRDRLRHLKLLRRQPEWMDGSFVTPFTNTEPNERGEKEEIHTYWPDGTFSFTRSSQCTGYISSLFAWDNDNGHNNNNNAVDNNSDNDDIVNNSNNSIIDYSDTNNAITTNSRGENDHVDLDDNNNNNIMNNNDNYDDDDPYANVCHVGDRIQYVDFSPPPNWPPWTKFCYRPGVSLLRLPKTTTTTTTTTTTNTLLVAQRMLGIRPPELYPRYEHANLVPIGTSRFFNSLGDIIIENNTTNEDQQQQQNDDNNNKTIMISNMEIKSLPPSDEIGTTMPPEKLIEKNRHFCLKMKEAMHNGVFDFPIHRFNEVNNNNNDAGFSSSVNNFERMILIGEEILHEALGGE